MYDVYAKLRDRKGLSDYEVSKCTGITPVTFSDWKKGKSAPKVDKLVRIARFFGVSLDYLVTGREATTAPQQLRYSRQVWELLVEAEKANTDDLRAVTDMLRRLNGYAAAIKEQERGTDADRQKASVRELEL